NAVSKLVSPGRRVSLNAFLLGLSVLAVPLIRTCFGHLDWVYDYLTETPGKAAVCAHTAIYNGLLLLLYRGPLYQVAVRACFLGVFGCGLIISFSESTWTHFGWYMCSLSFFHYSEYLVTAIINPHSLSLDSFLLNHSVEYTLAALSSWVEFTVEKLTVP
uniref:Isoprenylcysteine carboxyl methyltransferase n=1 Tax=Tetraodon nigroviridis TaxID=99883 RepID=H3C7W8_TETNG